jgi:hypothetical protein
MQRGQMKDSQYVTKLIQQPIALQQFFGLQFQTGVECNTPIAWMLPLAKLM